MHRAHSARRVLTMAETMLRLHPDDIKAIVGGLAEVFLTAKNAPEPFVDINELKEIIGVPLPTIYKWSHKADCNGFPCSKAGRKLRFRVTEVQEWMMKNRNRYERRK